MSILSAAYFHDEAAAFEHVEAILWENGPVCPHCGGMDRVYALKDVKGKTGKVRHGLKKCGHCRKQFTVRIGTIFEESHLPMHKWLQVIYLMCSSKKGVSAHQLHRTLEVTYKTAWFLAHRIREAMRTGELAPMGGSGMVVEADETYFGDKEVVTKRTKRGKSGLSSKRAIVGLVERGGSVRTFHIDRATKANVGQIVAENVNRETTLNTDESRFYGDVGALFAAHHTVMHTANEYVRGEAYTNTIEGVFSIFKRGMKGVYQHCSEKHLHRYLAEFDFRYNNRIALGVDDKARAARALDGVKGKRLTYKRSNQATI
ncbi:transposase [Devosia geojensis]|uniref:Transposase n=1 Tax=Devosia geojensis TaxID=443610 RepID=A0A0F5FVW1_9HYPH|nr:IS1595 family transposase [Devosia geojensis]KKB12695.1 transposase [Devosia geojensis]